MPLCREFKALCEAWVDKHKDNPCELTNQNGRIQLVEGYWRLVGKVSYSKANASVSYLINKYRGIISPEKLIQGTKRKR